MAGEVVNQKEFKRLIANMRKFPDRVQKNVVVGSTRAASAVITKEAKQNVPKKSGELKKAIVTRKSRTSKASGIIKFSTKIKVVVLKNGEDGSKNTRQYAYYLEYGTKYITAVPFLRPAFQSVGERPLTAARAYFAPRLEKEKRKLGFK